MSSAYRQYKLPVTADYRQESNSFMPRQNDPSPEFFSVSLCLIPQSTGRVKITMNFLLNENETDVCEGVTQDMGYQIREVCHLTGREAL